MKDNTVKHQSERPKVVRRAREFADAGDRLFVSVAQGLGRIGDWAYQGAGGVADTAVSKIAQPPSEPRRRRASSRPAPARGAPASEPPTPKAPEPPLESAIEQACRGADLLSATVPPDGDEDSSSEEQAAREPMWPSPDQSAGVVPLVRALGNVVGEYSQVGYRELDRDERFWKLLNLIWLLTDTWEGAESIPPSAPEESEDAAARIEDVVEAGVPSEAASSETRQFDVEPSKGTGT